MTITQLSYIVALDDLKSFSKAALFCCVSQPSLSMQIQKLEEELNIPIFNRKSKPISTTLEGTKIVVIARRILLESKNILSLSKGWNNDVSGSISIGIIPTIAPYLIPKFLSKFQNKYVDLSIRIAETTTENIKRELKEGKLDIGILVTPLNDEFIEIPLYYESLYLFSNSKDSNGNADSQINPNKLWLLEEGHCLSNQINSICNLENRRNSESKIAYDTGSLETIVRLADDGEGQTIIPQMLIEYLDEFNRNKVFNLPKPTPVREVSMIHLPNFNRNGIINAFKNEILSIIPNDWKKKENRNIIPI